MDKITKEKRHKIMASIHGKDTKPELIVRHFLFSRGFRYRVNNNRLPGKPDIVLFKYRTVIFVNGCFWHGHNCKDFRKPRSNVSFWEQKINRNKARDIKVQKELHKMGWHVIVVWECQLKKEIKEQTLTSLEYTLNSIFLHDRTIIYYPDIEEDNESCIAAEPMP